MEEIKKESGGIEISDEENAEEDEESKISESTTMLFWLWQTQLWH